MILWGAGFALICFMPFKLLKMLNLPEKVLEIGTGGVELTQIGYRTE